MRLEAEWNKQVGSITIHIDHDTSKHDELTVSIHPFKVGDFLDHFLDHGVGLVGKGSHDCVLVA